MYCLRFTLFINNFWQTMCLLIGPTGVGKTLLLKRLQTLYNIKDQENLSQTPATIPTVGTNLANVAVSKKQEVVVREIGGCMSPIWPKYYKKCSALVFMVDMSNKLQIAASCIQLLGIVSDQSLSAMKILVLLNKIDLPTCMSRFEFESLFRMDDLLKHSHLKITILEISAHTGHGLTDILQWMLQNSEAVDR